MKAFDISTYTQIRHNARKILIDSIEKEKLLDQQCFTNTLRNSVSTHRLLSHPIIELLKDKKVSKDNYKKILLDFRGLVSTFTDLLYGAAVFCRELEKYTGDGIKIHSRFLLNLNIIDEMGLFLFPSKLHESSSLYSHHLLFEEVLKTIEADENVLCFNNSGQSEKIKQLWVESIKSDFLSCLSCLISTEVVALHINPALKINAEIFENLSFNSGYFYVHGSSSHDSMNAADDHHENDLWLLAAIAVENSKQSIFSEKIMYSMNKWAEFWDFQFNLAKT